LESVDFPEQMRLVNLQRLLLGLQTVKLSAAVSLKDEQVLLSVVQIWMLIVRWHLTVSVLAAI